MNAMEDLSRLIMRAQRDGFYGEMLIRWEEGQPVMIEVHQKVKPKDFEDVVFSITGSNNSQFLRINR